MSDWTSKWTVGDTLKGLSLPREIANNLLAASGNCKDIMMIDVWDKLDLGTRMSIEAAFIHYWGG